MPQWWANCTLSCWLTIFFLFLYQIPADWSVSTQLWYHHCRWEGHTDRAGCHQDRAGCLSPVRCPVQHADGARAPPALRGSEGARVDKRTLEWASQWVGFPSISWNASSKLVMTVRSHPNEKVKMQNLRQETMETAEFCELLSRFVFWNRDLKIEFLVSSSYLNIF